MTVEPLKPMTDDRIRALAQHAVNNTLYTSDQAIGDLGPEGPLIVFVPLAGDLAVTFLNLSKMHRCMVYAVLGEDFSGFSYSGFPVFLECKICLHDDIRRVVDLAKAMVKAVAALPVAEPLPAKAGESK